MQDIEVVSVGIPDVATLNESEKQAFFVTLLNRMFELKGKEQ